MRSPLHARAPSHYNNLELIKKMSNFSGYANVNVQGSIRDKMRAAGSFDLRDGCTHFYVEVGSHPNKLHLGSFATNVEAAERFARHIAEKSMMPPPQRPAKRVRLVSRVLAFLPHNEAEVVEAEEVEEEAEVEEAEAEAEAEVEEAEMGGMEVEAVEVEAVEVEAVEVEVEAEESGAAVPYAAAATEAGGPTGAQSVATPSTPSPTLRLQAFAAKRRAEWEACRNERECADARLAAADDAIAAATAQRASALRAQSAAVHAESAALTRVQECEALEREEAEAAAEEAAARAAQAAARAALDAVAAKKSALAEARRKLLDFGSSSDVDEGD